MAIDDKIKEITSIIIYNPTREVYKFSHLFAGGWLANAK